MSARSDEGQPIGTAPRDGQVLLLSTDPRKYGGGQAAGFWHESVKGMGMWCEARPEGDALVRQLDFEPTHWWPTRAASNPPPIIDSDIPY